MAKRNRKLAPVANEVISVTRGSGNVFADLGFDDAGELQLKAELTRQISARIRELELTQIEAAKRLAISQPDVSKLMQGRYTGYSTDRLFGLLNALEINIEIVLSPVAKNGCYHPGAISITQAGKN